MTNISSQLTAFLLQQACGFEYTSKLQKMYTDTHTSKDLNDRFQEYCKSNQSTEPCKYTSRKNDRPP